MQLEIRDLTISYRTGGQVVSPIEDLDLDLSDGQLVLLLGPSGCGKTTLLSAIAGQLTPAAGSIVVDGEDVTKLGGKELVMHRRSRVGLVFQSFNLVPSLTALENVAAPLLAAGHRRRRAAGRARELLERLDLGHRLGHRPNQLSGGQQQRVAIARALVADPPLVLADEPTAHLDHTQVGSVRDLLRGLAAPGRLVIVATHDDRLLDVADHVVRLGDHHDAPAALARSAAA